MKCPHCGGDLVAVVGTPGILAGCESCDYLLKGVGDPPLPEMAIDFRDACLILDSVGPAPLKVAGLIRAFTGDSPQWTLDLMRSGQTVMARRSWEHVRDLERLRDELTQLGAVAMIQRLE